MKQAFGILLTAVLMLNMLWLLPLDSHASEVASGTYRDQVTWSLDDSGTLTISGTGYVDHDMGQRLWAWDVQRVVVEEGITSLSENAFCDYVNMTSITLPSTLTQIGSYAFKNCKKLEQIQIPESVTYIGSCAFQGCSLLKEIRIPDGVTRICGGLFQDCINLQKVDFPANVTEMEGNVFNGCSSLEEITIPSGLQRIEEGTFSGCTSLKYISIPRGVTFIANRAFVGCTALKTVWLPSTVETLARDSFVGCTNIKRVIYGGSRRNFLRLVYAELKNHEPPENHSLYGLRLSPRCVVTGNHASDLAMLIIARTVGLLLILGAGGLVVFIVLKTKKRNSRII